MATPKKMLQSEVAQQLREQGARKVGPGKFVTSAGLKVAIKAAEPGWVWVESEKSCIC